ncbi:MAG: hypothetical protein B7Z80_10245 [Rhodospirillales bacterium 20-64-7]|nr:MAG: hypothetical protein B7Z80_10245 [Rhodospirillales bacterium 20-64-7]
MQSANRLRRIAVTPLMTGIVFAYAAPAAITKATTTMSQAAILEVPNVMLQKGGFLPTAQLSHKKLGRLNADRSNAVLVPNWCTGTHADAERS